MIEKIKFVFELNSEGAILLLENTRAFIPRRIVSIAVLPFKVTFTVRGVGLSPKKEFPATLTFNDAFTLDAPVATNKFPAASCKEEDGVISRLVQNSPTS